MVSDQGLSISDTLSLKKIQLCSVVYCAQIKPMQCLCELTTWSLVIALQRDSNGITQPDLTGLGVKQREQVCQSRVN